MSATVVFLSAEMQATLETTGDRVEVLDHWGRRPHRRVWVKCEHVSGQMVEDGVYESDLHYKIEPPPTIIVDLETGDTSYVATALQNWNSNPMEAAEQQ